MWSRSTIVLIALASAQAASLSEAVSPIADDLFPLPPIKLGAIKLLPNAICEEIAGTLSPASQVYYAPHGKYFKGIKHWASSSTQLSACSVEPGTAEDVGTVLRIVNATRTPFAVKGGGHGTNRGFSSTKGVHISMAQFDKVDYNPSTKTATVGAGLAWDQVYALMEPTGRNVVGGRFAGVGVAGLTLGGGFSWLSNQHGLTIDTVVSYDLVLPTGVPKKVTQQSDPDLFFALRGGGNNFGIVTAFEFQTFPQGQVWGGTIVYGAAHIKAANAATEKFSSHVTDPKASIITMHNSIAGFPGVIQYLFYDAPTAPPGIFEDFLAIPSSSKDVKTRSFLSMASASPSNALIGTRGLFSTVSLTEITPRILDVIANETNYWGSALLLNLPIFISYSVEPFLLSAFTSNNAVTPSAYPPSRARFLSPFNVYFGWVPPTSDAFMKEKIAASAGRVQQEALKGQSGLGAPLYPNYALDGTAIEGIYGENTERLKTIRRRVDPYDVMYLAGGFKL